MPHPSSLPAGHPRREEWLARVSEGKRRADERRMDWEMSHPILGEMRVCRQCGLRKLVAEGFGTRWHETKGGRMRQYVRDRCLECDSESSAEYTAVKKAVDLDAWRERRRLISQKRNWTMRGVPTGRSWDECAVRDKVWLDPWPLAYWLGEVHTGDEWGGDELLRGRLDKACRGGRVELGLADEVVLRFGGRLEAIYGDLET